MPIISDNTVKSDVIYSNIIINNTLNVTTLTLKFVIISVTLYNNIMKF